MFMQNTNELIYQFLQSGKIPENSNITPLQKVEAKEDKGDEKEEPDKIEIKRTTPKRKRKNDDYIRFNTRTIKER